MNDIGEINKKVTEILLEILLKITENIFGISREVILSKACKRDIIVWRHSILYVLQQYKTPRSMINKIIKYDRSTLLYIENTIKFQKNFYPELANIIEKLTLEYETEILKPHNVSLLLSYMPDNIKQNKYFSLFSNKLLYSYLYFKYFYPYLSMIFLNHEVYSRRFLYYLYDIEKIPKNELNFFFRFSYCTIHNAIYSYSQILENNKKENFIYKEYVKYLKGAL